MTAPLPTTATAPASTTRPRDLFHYVIPSALNPGRWLVAYALPGFSGFAAPVADCPSQQSAQAEADRLNARGEWLRARQCFQGIQPGART